MHPVLFTIPLFGGLPVHTYGVLVATGFLAGIWWVRRESVRVGENPDLATDLVFYLILSGIVGSRIMYFAFTDREMFLNDPLSFFRLWEGGLAFHGGLIGAILVTVWFLRRHRRGFWRIADIFSPGLALGHAFGRVGCFMVGCCYGRSVDHDVWWSLIFPQHPKVAAPWGVPLFPTQPIEAAGNFAIFLLLVLLRRWRRFEGQIFACYLVLYALLRWVMESYRGEATRDFLLGRTLSMAQWLSLVMLVAALVIWRVRGRKTGEAG